MHMMIGGAGALALILLVAGAVVGWTLVLDFLPALLGGVAVGTMVGLGVALAAALREHRRSQHRRPSPPASAKGAPQRCPHCGSPVDPDLAICPTCYTNLKANCPRCGAIADIQETHCPVCGHKINRSSISSSSTTGGVP